MEKKFAYLTKHSQKIDILLKELNKLEAGKINYSVQEIQSIDISSNEKEVENRRILKETGSYLDLCNGYLKEMRLNKSNTRLDYDVIEKIETEENIDIDLSNLKNKIFTLANLSFKANYLTKCICENAIKTIVKEENSNIENEALKKIIKRLQLIYRDSNSENNRRLPLEEQLANLTDEITSREIMELDTDLDNEMSDEDDSTQYRGWRNDFSEEVSDKDAIRLLYEDLSSIWNVRDVLYEIKSQLNTELIKCLIQDNYKEFKNWGFAKDENNMWVLNIDHDQITERYSYHIPKKEKILNSNVVGQIEKTNLKYKLDFTSIVRKTNLDMIKEKIDGKSFLDEYKKKLINVLENVDLENYTKDDYNNILELYTLGKFISTNTFDKLIVEYPDLEKNFKILKEMIYPSKQANLTNINTKEFQTNYEQDIKSQIEEILVRTKRIYIQSGKNLDISASIYALRKHMKDELGVDNIEVVKIDAGENIKNSGLLVDAGSLDGLRNFNRSFKGKRLINANVQRAQKSACGVLKQYGFYVPDKIVQYADTVITDERILMPRYGLNIIRYLNGKKLFEFAEEQREDGTYLIETELTDDELEKYSKKKKSSRDVTDLKEFCNKRKSEIENSTKEIAKNMYVIHTEDGDKHVAIVDHIINCGAMISYSLGCDYYVSVANEKADFTTSKDDHYQNNRGTFTVNANPKKGNGRLPKELIEWCKNLRDNGQNDILKMVTVARNNDEPIERIGDEKPFVKNTEDMVVFGGPKTPHLFVVAKECNNSNDDIKKIIINEIKNKLNAKSMDKNDQIQVINNNIKNWKNISAKSIVESILSDTEVTLTEVENQGKIISNIVNEKGENEHDISRN